MFCFCYALTSKYKIKCLFILVMNKHFILINSLFKYYCQICYLSNLYFSVKFSLIYFATASPINSGVACSIGRLTQGFSLNGLLFPFVLASEIVTNAKLSASPFIEMFKLKSFINAPMIIPPSFHTHIISQNLQFVNYFFILF